MTYQGLVKSLVLPVGFRPPTELVYEDLRATALSRADLEADVRGINDSLELIRRTRGGGWPTEPVTEEIDYVDLVWHELEFREGYSLLPVVQNDDVGAIRHDDETRTSRAVLISRLAAWSSR